MRLHRIRVESFRGIAAQDVALAESGVTVVEAPNEAGKSSLLEAVGLVLDYKDSSTAQAVRDVQPVDRDVGSLVEVELSCGAYRLTCRKQFHRSRRTELHIAEPAGEQLRGGEAHNRLQQILDGHVDRALLAALWFGQGEAMRQVALRDSHALAHALDHAAGATADPALDGLFEAVRTEHQRWFTPKAHKPHKDLQRLGERVDELERHAEQLRRRLEALQADVDRSARLDRELGELAQRREELAPRVEGYRQQLAQIEELRAAAARHREHADLAEARREAADAELDRRRQLEEAVETGRRTLAELDADIAAHRDEAERLEPQMAGLVSERDQADARAQEARRAARRCRDDRELMADQAALADRQAVQRKVAEADAAARDAEALLAACQLTDERLAAIDDAHHQLRVADAQLEAGAPTVTVEALESVEVAVDGEPTKLVAGERHERGVAEPVRLTVGDAAAVRVHPGTSLAELTEARRAALARLEAACDAAGVADPAEAHEVVRQRREAESAVAGRDRRVAELLSGGTRDSLASEIHELAARVKGRLASRDDAPLPADLTEATARRDAAEAAAEEAEQRVEQARAAVADAEPRLQQVRETLVERRARHQAAAEQLEQDRAALARARESQADDDLAADRDAHERQRREAEAHREQADQELAAAQPEQVQMLADNAERELADLDQQLETLGTERVEVRAGLRATGEEGLGQQLAEAEAELQRAVRDRDREWRRARAAQLLHDVMADERGRAQTAYRQPLKQAIDRLGRLVYDDSFSVEVGDDLSVTHRTLAGRTVQWGQLSGGAKEQLAILSALAAGSLIDEGGAPLVLDDALGFTDPERLERMSAVLSTVGRDGQVIVLTCAAERYRHVAGATTQRLETEPACDVSSCPVRGSPG